MSARRWTLCHTGDWHLGQSFYGRSRREEHEAFLRHLTRVLEENRVDVLVVAGDVFDTANPSGDAQALFFNFLSEAHRRIPTLETLVVAGNHDSAARLGAPAAILSSLNIRLVTRVDYRARGSEETMETSRLIHRVVRNGETLASIAMVPFLRPSDLPSQLRHEDAAPSALETSIGLVYEEVQRAIAAQATEHETRVAVGHLELRGAVLSQASERTVMGGHGVPDSVFGAGFDYVALGHLHLGQICGDPRVAYSGSPIPLSFQEADYEHAVRLIEFDGRRVHANKTIRIPHARTLLRFPKDGFAPREQVLKNIAQLEKHQGTLRPWAEVRIALDEADPGLRKIVDTALRAHNIELVRLGVEYRQQGDDPLAAENSNATAHLNDARLLFREKWRQSTGEEPNDVDLALFAEALALAEEQQNSATWSSAGDVAAIRTSTGARAATTRNTPADDTNLEENELA